MSDREGDPAGMNDQADTPFISVVIPTLNREKELCDILCYFLNEEEYPSFEIVVIDQSEHHTGTTTTYLQSIADRIIRRTVSYKNLPKARNEGVALAQGSIIVFVDDDAMPQKGFLHAHAAPYDDASVAGVTGPVVAPQGKLVSRADIGERAYGRLLARTEMTFDVDFTFICSWAAGGNMSFRKEVIVALGGFDEQLIGPAIGEDAEFSHRVKKSGRSIVYNPAARIIHKQAITGGTRSGKEGIYIRNYAFNVNYFFWKVDRTWWQRYYEVSKAYRSRVANKRNALTGRWLVLTFFFLWGVLKSDMLISGLVRQAGTTRVSGGAIAGA